MATKFKVVSCAFLVAGLALASTATSQAALVGASPYPNLLAGATVTDFGIVGHPEITINDNGAMSRAVDGGVGIYGTSQANKYVSAAEYDAALRPPAFMEWGLPSGTFSARSFISEQGGAYNGPFTRSNPYQFSANLGGGAVLTDIAGQNSLGLPLTSPFVVTSTASPIVASKVHATFSDLYETAGLAFWMMQEVIAVSDPLTRVTLSGASSPNDLGGYPSSQLIDNNEHLGWATPGAIGDSITVTLSGTHDLGAIMITGIEPRSEQFDIYFNNSLTPTVTGVEWAGLQNMALLKLDTYALGVTSITLKFTAQSFDPSDTLHTTPLPHYLGEMLAFEVPEPASAGLLAVSLLALISRRRRRVG